MATTVATMVERTRRYMHQWETTTLSGSLTAGATAVSLSNSTVVSTGAVLEVGTETMLVTAGGTGSCTVARGRYGSTAVTHASADAVYVNPKYYASEIIDALADGIDAAFPYVYRRVKDASLTILDSTYEYIIPTDSSTSEVIPFVYQIELQDPGDLTYRRVRNWRLIRAATAPLIHFQYQPTPGAAVRVLGYCRFPRLTYADSLDASWPTNLEFPLCEYAGSYLLISGEIASIGVGETTTTTQGTVVTQTMNNPTVTETGTNPTHTTLEDYDAHTTTESWAASNVKTTASDAATTQTTTPSGSDVVTIVRTGANMQMANLSLQRYLRRIVLSGYPPMSRHVIKAY